MTSLRFEVSNVDRCENVECSQKGRDNETRGCSSVVTVPKFTLSVGYCRFFEKKTAIMVSVFDEWLSLQWHQGWPPDGPRAKSEEND